MSKLKFVEFFQTLFFANFCLLNLKVKYENFAEGAILEGRRAALVIGLQPTVPKRAPSWTRRWSNI